MTELAYLDDTYLFTATATVQGVEQAEDGRTVVFLDRTILYPQGGGQPADHGSIASADAEFNVQDIRLDPEGRVYHFGAFTSGTLAAGDRVTIVVDENRRRLHARLHSAGHLLDLAMQRTGRTDLVPKKGYHFEQGPYVEYEGGVEPEDREALRDELMHHAADLLAENPAVEKENLSSGEAETRGISAPPGKSVRVVNFAGHMGCGCGGTHVQTAAEIGEITVRKVSSKKGMTKVAYSLT